MASAMTKKRKQHTTKSQQPNIDMKLIDVNIRLNDIISGMAASRKIAEHYNESLINQIQHMTAEITWRDWALNLIHEAVTLVNCSSMVVYQNHTSKAWFGDMLGQVGNNLLPLFLQRHSVCEYASTFNCRSVSITFEKKELDVHVQSVPPGHVLLVHSLKNRVEKTISSTDIPESQDKSARSKVKLPSRKTILHIDDDKNILDIVRLMLRNHPYKLISELDGRKAAALVKQYRPHLLILDIMMPEVNGFEIIQQFRSNPETRHLPIIVLSVSDSEEKCLELGANKYLAKPIEEAKLIEAVRSQLD